tara:strand:+ start:2251 stop:3075 length:825 start_codon:yes stop_codon:yes gene_type:complete
MKKTLLFTTAFVGLATFANAQTTADAKIGRIEKRMIALEKQVYSGKSNTSGGVQADNKLLAQMQVKLDNMQEQNANLYGKVEELSFAVEKLAEQVKLMSEDFDYRLNELETKAAAAPAANAEQAKDGATATAAPAKQVAKKQRVRSNVPDKLSPEKLYEKAYNYLTLADYSKSADWFETFIERFPQHKYADNSYYWLGEIALVQNDTNTALSYFARGLKMFPNGSKAPANLLKIGVAFKQTGKLKHAKNSWSKLVKDYPNTPEAKKAQSFLAEL